MKRHIFIIGAKSIGQYGGYETFVDKLTEYHKNCKEIQYHVFCKKNGEGHMSLSNIKKKDIISPSEFIYNNAKCYLISVPQIGPAQAIYYDLASLNKAIDIIKIQNIESPIIYILACRIGPFMKYYSEIVHNLGGKIYINPDGHEWMRSKWGPLTRRYWKRSEELMVKYADLVICDSKCIEKYIHKEYNGKHAYYKNPKTTYIAYGADIKKSKLKNNDKLFISWLNKYGLSINKYYLVVGRFVPENNYETIIREFMHSDTNKKLAIITNQNNKFYNKLQKKYNFEDDDRIVFTGTVYDQELLKKIRENAFAYIHGHSVGGTNPSLLEAMASTKLILLYDCCFNREVAKNGSLYWNKNRLVKYFNELHITCNEHNICKKRINDLYNWKLISSLYKYLYFI